MLFNNNYFDIGKPFFYNDNINLSLFFSDSFPINVDTYLKSRNVVYDNFLFVLDSDNKLLCLPFDIDGNFISLDKLISICKSINVKIIDGIFENSDIYNILSKKFRHKISGEYGYEYIYNNESLYKMVGSSYRNFRHKIKRFEKYYIENITIKKYDESMYEDAISAYNIWYNTNAQKILDSGKDIWDTQFYKYAIANYKKYNLESFLIYDLDECVGCVSFIVMNEKMAYGVFRKLTSEYEYIAQYMQWYQAKILYNRGVTFLNDAYDSGFVGLENLKSDFKPVGKHRICRFYLC